MTSDTNPDAAKSGASSSPAPLRGLQQEDVSFSAGLAEFLARHDLSLAFTSYQAGGLYLVGRESSGQLALNVAGFQQAMGLAGDAQQLWLGTQSEVIRFENVLQLGERANHRHDCLFVPRSLHVTGDIRVHELGLRQDRSVVFVNTRYSCLCDVSDRHSFRPVWTPRFISRLAPEDRCHLNGLAMRDGAPAFASAVCQSDVVDGWRDHRRDGGVVIDIATDQVVACNLSMPHSPRWHDGRLWIANSGTGELGWIDETSGHFRPLCFCPGFLRGLDFADGFAFVTLSLPRHERFEGLALEETLLAKNADAWCGVFVISLATGDVVHWIRFDGLVKELFDIKVLKGLSNPFALALGTPELLNTITIDA